MIVDMEQSTANFIAATNRNIRVKMA